MDTASGLQRGGQALLWFSLRVVPAGWRARHCGACQGTSLGGVPRFAITSLPGQRGQQKVHNTL
jgi:hypothetical protein